MRELVLELGAPALFLAFAATFAAMTRIGRVFAWWSGAFVAAAAAYGLSVVPTPDGSWSKPLLEDALFLLSLAVVNVGFARRADRPVKGTALTAICLGSLAAAAIGLVGFGSVDHEILAILAGCGLLMALSAFEMRHERAHAMEPVLFWVCVAVTASLVLQGVAFLASSMEPMTLTGWRTTNWGFVFQVSSAATGVLLAFAMLLASGFDIVVRLRETSQSDELTRIPNRRGFEQRAATLRARAAPGAALTVVLADLDHFKLVNDRFGHAAGDLVLQSFAALLAEAAGSRNGAARLGGEEFALLFSPADAEGVDDDVERVRALLAAHSWPPHLEDLRVTASFGIAPWRADEPLSAALARADAALYAAKREGRDRVVHAPAPTRAEKVPAHRPATRLEPC